MKSFDIDNIRAAASRLAGQVVTTPLLSSPQLDALTGCTVLVKAENLQLTGAFKIRGALNKILGLTDEQRRQGVVAFSSGNHGQAVAAAAKLAGCHAVIVLPANAPQIKIDNCRWWGAEVVLYDPLTQDRETAGEPFIRERGMVLVHPFDDPDIMAGQGTAGLEICTQAAAQGHHVDTLVINCSGGGLASGIVTAVANTFPEVETFLIEPEGGEKMKRSLTSKQPQRNPRGRQTILDALNGPNTGALPLQVLGKHAVHCLSVSDTAALQAMATAFRLLKIVVEPGGAASLAALLQNPDRFRGRTVVVVCSGGNVDAALFARALNHPAH